MSNTVPIIYSGFYDAPLAFAVRYEGAHFLFLREFDEVLDEYPDTYQVFILPDLSDDEINVAWGHIVLLATQSLGTVAVSSVVFDVTKRLEIGTPLLDRLLAGVPKPTQEMAKA